MIETILRGSIPGRIAAYLQKCYQNSLLAAFCRALALAYGGSAARRAANALLARPSATKNSRYMRILRALNNVLHRTGTWLEQAWKRSVFRRLGATLFQNGLAKNSLLYKLAAAVGCRRLMLMAFGFQLFLDYALRNIGRLAFAAPVWDEALMLLGIVVIIAERITSRNRIEPVPTPIDAALWLFMALSVFLMLAVSPVMGIAVSGLRAVIQFMFWFFIVSRLIRDKNDWMYVIIPIFVIAAAVSLHGIYQYIIGVEIPAQWISTKEVGVRTRVFSIFGSPNIMGAFLVMTAPVCAALAYIWKGWGFKILAWCSVVLACVACLVTFSRGAWLGMAAAVFVFALLVDRRLFLVALAAAGAAVFIPQVSNRITYLFTGDFAERTLAGGREQRWAAGMQLLRSVNQVLGVGLGRFGGAVAMQNQVMERVNYFYMDNYYLKTLVEMGYAGLFGYIFLLASTVISSLRRIFALNKTKAQILAAGIFSGMAGILVHSYFENIFEVPYMNAYFWGLAAVLLTLGREKGKAA